MDRQDWSSDERRGPSLSKSTWERGTVCCQAVQTEESHLVTVITIFSLLLQVVQELPFFIISDVMRSLLSCSSIVILTVSVCSGVLGWLSLFWFLISLAPLGDSILTLLPNLKIDVISIVQSLLYVKTAKLSREWNWKITLLNEFLAVFPFRSFHRRSSPLCHWKQQEGCSPLLEPGQPSYWGWHCGKGRRWHGDVIHAKNCNERMDGWWHWCRGWFQP